MNLLANRLHFNGWLIPTLLVGLALWWITNKHIRISWLTWTIAIFLAIPGTAFVVYYLHVLDEWAFYYTFRTWPGTELSAAGMGVLAGHLQQWGRKTKRISNISIPCLLSFGLIIPHAKPILYPLNYDRLQNQPAPIASPQHQSSGVSCGPASMATILAQDGRLPMTEVQIAKHAFTYSRGTEVWYLGRLFNRLDYHVRYRVYHTLPTALHTPCIAGVDVGSFGHFIPIVRIEGDKYIVGDPLGTAFEAYTHEELLASYRFTGFFMELTAPIGP